MISQIIRTSAGPITGSELAAQMKVTRQVVVQDIALLRESGLPIVATPAGYIWLEKASPSLPMRVFSCQHTTLAEAREELMIMVNAGGIVRDIIVDHAVYGEIVGSLLLRTPEDVEALIERLGQPGVQMLSSTTCGSHMHTVEAPSELILDQIEQELKKAGLLSD
ncbi:MAG: 3H domain-containing protein [Bacillota bacterium]|jgi:transcriptional regulator of NAD metabolism